MTDLRNRVRFSSTLRKDLREDIKKLSNDTRLDQSVLLDEAIEDLLKKYKKKERS